MSPKRLRKGRQINQSTSTRENTRKTKSLNFSHKEELESFIKDENNSHIVNNISRTEKIKSSVKKREYTKSKSKTRFSPSRKVSNAVDSETGEDFVKENNMRELRSNTSNINGVVPLDQTITPKSSPISVSLTPHRSTKTPKKSPVNMASPKTITEVQAKVLKTPRKLLLGLNSSNILDKSYESSDNEIQEGNNKEGKREILRRVSKSPKIVLKSPKPKSAKHKMSAASKKKGVVSLVLKKSLRYNTSPTMESKLRNSSMKEDDSGLSLNEINYESINSVVLQKNKLQMNPVVLLEKNVFTDNKKELLSPQEDGQNDVSRYNLRTSVKTDMKINMSLSPQTDNTNETFSSSQQGLKCSDINLSLHLSLQTNNIQCTKKDTEKEDIQKEEDTQKEDNTQKEDDTQKDEKESALNETYELNEPKTPDVRMKAARQKSLKTDLENSLVKEEKKTYRVRFTSPDPSEKEFSSIRSANTRSVSSSRKAKNFGTSTPVSTIILRKRSSSFSSESTKRNDSARRSLSLSNVTMRSRKDVNKLEGSTNKKLNRMPEPSSQRKDDSKKILARRIPDFTQIHKELFSNMESVVDKKKRLEERHKELTADCITSKLQSKNVKKYLPMEEHKEGHNRYGFKLHKREATELIKKKQKSTSSLAQKREENRVLLKGVRTNRRFELQMKSRNISMV